MAYLGTYFVVKCKKCGKQYGTTPDKLTKNHVSFRCKSCGADVTAVLPDQQEDGEEIVEMRAGSGKKGGRRGGSILKMGLTNKFLLFTLLPLILISVAVVFITDNRMRNLQRQTINSSSGVVQNISENLILQISRTVARQTRQYLFSHPDLRREKFNRDIYFKKVVLQKIGLTGSTSLYEMGGGQEEWLTWADVDPQMVGRDMQLIQEKLGEHFPRYWNIITSVKAGDIAKGVYLWPDSKGKLRKKFMVCTPIEGTPFVISASIFVDEITAPLKAIETEGLKVAAQIRSTLMIILVGGLMTIFLILLFYGRSLTMKIKRLADWADEISLGKMDSEPADFHSRDELGELTEAIERMQESIRISLDRLKRRRDKPLRN